MMVCSSPADCAEIERRHATGSGCSPTAARAAATCSRARRRRRSSRSAAPTPRSGAEPRLPRVPRQRLQRHARARAVRLGDRPRDRPRRARRAPRRAPARPPRRHLSADARRDVRVRPRPRRLRRAERHDARAARGLRDVRQLRRGRAPLRARARRHARGAAQARPAVRPHRARPPLRAAAVRDRRALRPRPDAGRDVQAAQRLRPRRARRALARRAATWPASPAATSSRRWSRHAVDEATGAQAGRKRGRRTTSPAASVVVLGSGNLGLVYLMERAAPADARGDRGAPPAAASPRCARTRTSAGCSCAPAEHGALVLGPRGHAPPRRRPGRGRGPARAVLAERRAAPAAHGRLRPRRRHHGRQLLRPDARRGLRVRGAHLVPRRARRAADPAVHPAPAGASPRRTSRSSARPRSTSCSPGGARPWAQRIARRSRRSGQPRILAFWSANSCSVRMPWSLRAASSRSWA